MNTLRTIVSVTLCLGLGAACAKSRRPQAAIRASVAAPKSMEDAGAHVPFSPPAAEDAGISAPDASGGSELSRMGATVQIGDHYRSCGTDDDCILVGTSCNGCCDEDAIRAQDRAAYQASFDRACDGYSGPACDCAPPDLVAHCEAGSCAAVARDPLRDCYSPTQNTARAYDTGAVGCACDPPGLRICVGGASLACKEAASGSTWATLDKESCSEPPINCLASRPDATACLAEFAICFELQTGGFCGTGCRAPLDCNQAGGCDYKPFDPATCGNPFPGAWEGSCGSVRWRAESGGYGGPTWYWDKATGKLLAVSSSTDTEFFCNNSDFELTKGDFRVAQDCKIVIDDSTALCSMQR